MAREWANRFVFILACLGAFIALVIGVAHSTNVELPCGGVQSGCDILAQPEYSRWFGIPIAFYGLALYLIVALSAFCRAVLGPENSPRLGTAMWFMLAVGTVISLALIGYAFNTIHATCLWCLASATVMTATFLVHTWGMAKTGDDRRGHWRLSSYGLIFLVFIAAGGAYGYHLAATGKEIIGSKLAPVIKEVPYFLPSTHSIGDPKAPVKIVEFTDLYCPTCRRNDAFIQEQLNGPLKGKVLRYVRHWPVISQHPLALQAAMFSEWAAEKGKFWQFVDAVHAIPEEQKTDVQRLLKAVQDAGLDVQYAAKLLNDDKLNKKYYAIVATDIGAGNKLGVESTPHWIIIYPKDKPEAVVGSGIRDLLTSRAFTRKMEAK